MDLIKWEFKQTLKSRSFWVIGIALLILCNVFHIPDYINGGVTGYDIFFANCEDFSSTALLFLGIFTGLHVTGALEDRKIQAAVMAGNSRAKVLGAKYISFVMTIILYFVTATAIPSAIGFMRFGTAVEGGTFMNNVVLSGLFFLIAEISLFSLCFLFSMLVKKSGFAIIINMITMIGSMVATQFIATKEWGIKFLEYTPFGQYMTTLGDPCSKTFAITGVTAVVFIALVLAASFMHFRKEELK